MNNNSNQGKSTIKVENEDKIDFLNHQPQCPIPCLQSNPSFQQRSAKSDPSNLLPSLIKDKYKTNTRFEEWSVEEVVRLFEIYEEHGSQWKFFQQWFPERSTNSIKNRFYTALRNTFKVLFREHKQIQGKLPHQIPSKDLVRLFEGREEFERFANIGKALMMEMNYTAHPRTAKIVCQKYADTILQIFTVIYGLELHEITQKLVDEQRPPIAEPIKKIQKKSQENNPPAASMQNNFLFYPYTLTGNENCYLYYSYPVIYYYQ